MKEQPESKQNTDGIVKPTRATPCPDCGETALEYDMETGEAYCPVCEQGFYED